MKWVRVEHKGLPRFGILQNDAIVLTSLTWSEVLEGRSPDSLATVDPQKVRNLAPLERPGKIIAIGLNYMDHCRETNSDPPSKPLIFCKLSTSLLGPGEEISWSRSLTDQVDYEAELAVVVGHSAREVSRQEALQHVFGYTVGNDVSARDLQFSDGQWIRGKSLDTFCPLGPVLVTADEIPTPQNLGIRTYLNGEIMQESNTREMIFPVAELISFCSQAFTLEPGDVIMTGTPHGVGVGRDPQVFMNDGDQIVIEVDGICRLENTCRTRD